MILNLMENNVDFYSSHNKDLQLAILYCWIITEGSFFVMPTDEQTCIYLKPNLL